MEVNDLVEYMKEVKQKREELEDIMNKKMQEEKELKNRADSKIDKTSGFYKDIEDERKAKHSEWSKAFNEREKYKKQSSEKINNIKEELISQLEETANQIDENRHLKKEEIEQKVSEGYKEVKELNSKLYSKKQELKYFESTIPEGNEDKKKIIDRKQGEVDSLDNQIKRKIISIQEIQKMSKEEPEKLYNDIKEKIEYVKNLTIENIEEKPTSKEKEQKAIKKDVKEKEEEPKATPKELNGREEEPKVVSKKPEEKRTESKVTSKKLEKETESEKNSESSETENIYSSSKDEIKFIDIKASTGKAYISTSKNNNKEIDIKEAIENRKGLYKRIGIKEIMQRLGIDSKIKQFALKRKMNPVILQAIHEDKDLAEEYIECLIEHREFPFKYKNSLMNSSLSNKDTAFMNRIALKERKIEENEIVGAERLYKIKTFFKNIKNKVNKRIETRKVEMLDSAENKETNDNTKSKKEEFRKRIEKYNEQDSIQKRADKIVTELENKYDEAYNSLSDEQKSKLPNMSIRDIQKLGFDYSTSVALSEKQEKNNDENGKEKDDER